LRLPAMMMKHGLRVEAIHPLHRIARPNSPLWLWPTTFLHSFVPTLVAGGFLSEAHRQAFEREWSACSNNEGGFYWAPPVMEIIARKP
jgi:hypothetical protein